MVLLCAEAMISAAFVSMQRRGLGPEPSRLEVVAIEENSALCENERCREAITHGRPHPAGRHLPVSQSGEAVMTAG